MADARKLTEFFGVNRRVQDTSRSPLLIDLSFEEEEVQDVNLSPTARCAAPQQASTSLDRSSTFTRMNELYRSNLTSALIVLDQIPVCEDAELVMIKSILGLSQDAMVILSRVMFLQGPWLHRSKVESYLIRAGSEPPVAAERLCELLDGKILASPTTQEECITLIGSPCVSRAHLLALAKALDPKARVVSSTKDDLSAYLIKSMSASRSLFGKAPVQCKSLLARAGLLNEYVRINPLVFRLCRRALGVRNLFVDFVDTNREAIGALGDLKSLRVACLTRGGLKLSALVSPGYKASIGLSSQLDVSGRDPNATLQEENLAEEDSVGFVAEEEYGHFDLAQSEKLGTMRVDVDCEKEFIHALCQVYSSKNCLLLLEASLDLYTAFLAATENSEIDDKSLMAVEHAIEASGLTSDCSFIAKRGFFFDVIGVDANVGDLIRIALSMLQHPDLQESNPVLHVSLLPYCDPSHYILSSLAVGVTWLEKTKRYTIAIDLLKHMLFRVQSFGARMHTDRSDWWERLVIDLEHLGAKDVALEMARMALSDQSIDVSRDPSMFGLRARVEMGPPPVGWASIFLVAPVVVIQAKPFGKAGKGSGVRGKQKFVDIVDNENVTCSVEELALTHYAEVCEEGPWYGLHTENGAVHLLFDMFMLSACTPLGGGGLDGLNCLFAKLGARSLTAKELSVSQRLAISERSKLISSWDAKTLMEQVGIAFNSLPRRRLRGFTLPMAQIVAVCLGSERLALLCASMADNYAALGRGGGPDLLLVKTANGIAKQVLDSTITELKYSHLGDGLDIKFVEVKSENDRLSNKQIHWLNTLYSLNIKSEVLKISINGNERVGRTPSLSKTDRAMTNKRSKVSLTYREDVAVEQNERDYFEDLVD